MSIKYRRALYIIFIAVFFIGAPLIIMYATGYRYNFKNHRVEKTGILSVNSTPKNADIYLNNKLTGQTPKRFPRLLPDTYNLEIKKDNYYSWGKKIKIASGLTTFAQNIVLFKEDLPINIIDGDINILSASPNNEKMLYSVIKDNTEELRLVNLKNGDDFPIETFNLRTYNNLEFIDWSVNQNKAILTKIVGDFHQYLIVNTDTLKIKELFDITRLDFDKISWDQSNQNLIYGLRKAVLYQIDLTNNSTKTLLSANIQNFYVIDSNIFYIEKVANEIFLNKVFLEGGSPTKTEKIKLPSPSEFIIAPSTKEYIALLDKKNNDFFLIDPTAFTEQNIEKNVILQDRAKNISWSNDFSKIIFYTDFEISIFDIATKQKNLITRFGEVINQAVWYPENNYILYNVGNKIRSSEATSDDIRYDIQIIELPKINNMVVDASGNNIYFKGSVGTQKGIYKLEIQ